MNSGPASQHHRQNGWLEEAPSNGPLLDCEESARCAHESAKRTVEQTPEMISSSSISRFDTEVREADGGIKPRVQRSGTLGSEDKPGKPSERATETAMHGQRTVSPCSPWLNCLVAAEPRWAVLRRAGTIPHRTGAQPATTTREATRRFREWRACPRGASVRKGIA